MIKRSLVVQNNTTNQKYINENNLDILILKSNILTVQYQKKDTNYKNVINIICYPS